MEIAKVTEEESPETNHVLMRDASTLAEIGVRKQSGLLVNALDKVTTRCQTLRVPSEPMKVVGDVSGVSAV
jgi:hypothetical protein